jgi:hypothetical protein
MYGEWKSLLCLASCPKRSRFLPLFSGLSLPFYGAGMNVDESLLRAVFQ